jgi:hypothetical protein
MARNFLEERAMSLFLASVALGTMTTALSTRLGPRRRRRSRFGLALPGAWVGLFLTGFGAAGIVLEALHTELPLWRSSALVGFTIAFPLAALVEGYLRTANAKEVATLEGRAREGILTVAIPPKGLGRVQFVAQGKRCSRPARTANGRALAAGLPVLIVSLRRHVAVVESLTP